ncbi:MAG: extracellular solute-binding protein [Anaerolineae bacterium]|nr:extracellular solute-binding protein [Anaerolineae bacterium]
MPARRRRPAFHAAHRHGKPHDGADDAHRHADAGPSETPAPTVSRRTLRLWLVEPLAPGGAIPAVLLEQLEAFRARHPTVIFDVRAKLPSGADGVLEVLRSTLAVAPDALPDLVLLSRADLVSAATANLVQRLEGRLPEEVVSDWFPVAREMSTFNGELYGASYVLDGQHLVFRQSAVETPPVVLDDLLDVPPPFLFPAGNIDTIVGQYMAGGGRLIDDEGRAVLDPDPLLAVLEFYQRAIQENVLPLTVLEYDNADGYVEDYLSGLSTIAQMNASTYLRRRNEMGSSNVALVPAVEGPSVTVITGWSWAMVTTDPDRQALVVELLGWLMQPERLGAFSRDSRWLPSQRTALQIWGDEAYGAFAEALLAEATLRPTSAARLTAARAMQDALRSVLLERLTAQEATNAAVASVTQPDS